MGETAFTRVSPELEPVLAELRPMEPIFHTEGFGMAPADFERRMAPDYFEVGVSGRRYSRAFIVRTLAEIPPVAASSAGWECDEFGLRQLGPETYLLTYALRQGTRITHRVTIWQRTGEGWRILYHQGTLACAVEDDTMPRAEEMAPPSGC